MLRPGSFIRLNKMVASGSMLTRIGACLYLSISTFPLLPLPGLEKEEWRREVGWQTLYSLFSDLEREGWGGSWCPIGKGHGMIPWSYQWYPCLCRLWSSCILGTWRQEVYPKLACSLATYCIAQPASLLMWHVVSACILVPQLPKALAWPTAWPTTMVMGMCVARVFSPSFKWLWGE